MPDDYWIREAIKEKGSYRASVARRHGKKGFTRRGTIKQSVIEADSKKRGKLGRRARLAKTLRRI